MERLTMTEVLKRVEAIRKVAVNDDETAHSQEDTLHQDVLQAIADGRCDGPADCARAALETRSIEFSRWCA